MPAAIDRLTQERAALLRDLQRPPQASADLPAGSLAEPPLAPGLSPSAMRLSRAYDRYFQTQWAQASPPPGGCALVAVGGYGRQECSLHADIDILMAFAKAIPNEADDLAGELFRPLWDLKLDVGHGVRCLADCKEMAQHDMAVLASMLDARHIAGDATVTAALQQVIARRCTPEVLPGFLHWLDRERAGRASRYGEAFALLEPHLKAGVGGLREAHGARWLEQFLPEATGMDAPSLGRLDAGVGLLLEVRSRLHALCGSRQDFIPLEFLPELAVRCGYSGDAGPDKLLASLHRTMEFARAASIRQHRAAAGAAAPTCRDPWEALQHSAQTGEGIPFAIRMELERMPELDGPMSYQRLSRLLAAPYASVAVEALLETGALAAMLPAFGVSQDRIPFGGWHIHPVGRHSVTTLRYLESLQQEDGDAPNRLRAMWRQDAATLAGRWGALRWAALLHDVGKTPAQGSQGHAQRGANMAFALLESWGAPETLAEEVRFLINAHLLLAETAHAEDPNDQAVVSRIAGAVSTPERLHRLLLLTYADSRATGPRVWNDWSATLLFSLADAVEEAVAAADISPARSVREVLKRRDAIRVHGKGVYSMAALEKRLEGLDIRYVLAMPPAQVVAHLQLQDEYAKALAEARVRLPGGGQAARVALLEARPASRGDHAAWEVDVAGSRKARLLAVASGVLSLHGLDIMQADVFSWPTMEADEGVGMEPPLELQREPDSFVLHRFFVSPPPDPLYPDAFWARVRSTLTYALSGKVHLETRLAEKRASLLAAAPKAAAPPSVQIQEEGDGLRVVVEADDRIGLLHDIVIGLETAGGEVRVARIQTRGSRAHDHFHVVARAGRRLEKAPAVQAVLQALQ